MITCAHEQPSWDNDCEACNKQITELIDALHKAEKQEDLTKVRAAFAAFPQEVKDEMQHIYDDILSRQICTACQRWIKFNADCQECRSVFHSALCQLNEARMKVTYHENNRHFIRIRDDDPQANHDLYKLYCSLNLSVPEVVRQWSANHNDIIFGT